MKNTALLLVDIQKGLDDLAFYGGERNNPNAEANCQKILTHCRNSGIQVFHVKHNSTNPESPLFKGKLGNEIKSQVFPKHQEPVIEKNANSAFINTNLEAQLRSQHIHSLIIVGLTTEHCISTTARMAANLGFDVKIVSDATAAFNKIGIQGEQYSAEVIHLTSLAALKDEFATIYNTEEIVQMI